MDELVERYGKGAIVTVSPYVLPHTSHARCPSSWQCLPRSHRLDRWYCSSTCRARAHKQRQLAALERAAWETENPEAAAKDAAEYEAWLEGLRALEGRIVGPQAADARKHREELQCTADVCATCERPFATGDIIFRRRQWPNQITKPVLPYCAEHRCPQLDGHHNRDAPPGCYYANCLCDDKHWRQPKPCLGCGRLVSDPKRAPWRGLVFRSGWDEPSLPRTFCGRDCKRHVLADEAKVRRVAAVAEREPVRCAVCTREFKPRRRDARYCSNTCRQRACRRRELVRTPR